MAVIVMAAAVASAASMQRASALPAAAPPKDLVLHLDKAPVKGSKTARVVLVEVSDYECPFCGRYSREIRPQIEFGYVQTGRIRYAFVNMPIEARHKNAFKAAEAAACAGDQNKYWEMHDRLFATQTALAPIHLPIHAQALGLKADAFKTCLDSGRHAAEIRSDFAIAQQAGVTGTPAFFLAVADPGSTTLKVVKTITGAKPLAVFKQELDALLASTLASQAPEK